ncbi:MAG: phosphate butyryltransferase [Peptostreptococcaceae bacterium]|nr:phosphate butyryltransferase [Peptostreptococcaceae bacterium]
MRSFEEMLDHAKKLEPKVVAVACAHDEDVLLSIENARKFGAIHAILVGIEEEIIRICKELGIDPDHYTIINNADKAESSYIAAKLVSDKKADILMKGLVDTSIILKAVLNKELSLRTGKPISHCAVFEVPGYDRLIFVTDAAMNIAPDLETKVAIIENTVKLAHSIGVEKPKVGALCAKEKVDEKMPATVDAGELKRMNDEGRFKDFVVGGPFALDNAISQEAARHKGVTDPIAGLCDILLVPDIEAGNILYKSITYFQPDAKLAGIILGAATPIILTSRADSDEAKLNSIILSALYADKFSK